MQRYTDEEIWAMCLSGDESAFEELYKRYYALLLNYGCKFISERSIVHDHIQDLFLKLMLNYGNLSQNISPKPYLLRSLRNKIYDQTKISTVTVDFDVFKDHLPAVENVDNDDEYFAIMRDAYIDLSSKQKEIIYLYFIKDLSHRDIGSTLGINNQSSKNLLHRSLIRLREIFFEKLKKSDF